MSDIVSEAGPAAAATPSGPRHGKNAFVFVIVTVTLDMVGYGLIIPVMPALLEDITGLGANETVVIGGFLTALYAAANFIANPIIGGLSDRFGRRPVLLVSIGTLAIDFVIMGLAHSLWLLFIGRFLAGVSAATFSTANAYIADVTTSETRGAAFGMLGAAFAIGFVVGPALGGVLAAIDIRLPFFAAAALAGLNFLYGLLVLPESLAPQKRRRFELARANPFGAFKHFRKLPMVMWFIVAVGIERLAHSVYPATWSYHGKIRYDWADSEIGLSLALFGVCSGLVQALLTGRAIRRFGLYRTVFIGLVINVAALMAMAFAGYGALIYIITPFAALGGIAGPALNTLMSNLTPENAQGELHGATASIGAIAMVISPLMMTQTLNAFSADNAVLYFPGAAFLLAAIITSLALIPFAIGWRVNRDADLQAEKDELSTLKL